MFERAIELDAGYGPAWSCLADGACHALRVVRRPGRRSREGGTRPAKRRWNWRRSLRYAHVARGFVLSLSARYDEAAREFEQAIRLNPNLFDAYYYFARSSFAAATSSDRPTSFGRRRTSARKTFKARCCWRSRCACSGRAKEAAVAGRGRDSPRRAHARAEPARLHGRSRSVRWRSSTTVRRRARSNGRGDRSSSIRTT